MERFSCWMLFFNHAERLSMWFWSQCREQFSNGNWDPKNQNELWLQWIIWDSLMIAEVIGSHKKNSVWKVTSITSNQNRIWQNSWFTSTSMIVNHFHNVKAPHWRGKQAWWIRFTDGHCPPPTLTLNNPTRRQMSTAPPNATIHTVVVLFAKPFGLTAFALIPNDMIYSVNEKASIFYVVKYRSSVKTMNPSNSVSFTSAWSRVQLLLFAAQFVHT
jgi:hypothetical protein